MDRIRWAPLPPKIPPVYQSDLVGSSHGGNMNSGRTQVRCLGIPYFRCRILVEVSVVQWHPFSPFLLLASPLKLVFRKKGSLFSRVTEQLRICTIDMTLALESITIEQGSYLVMHAKVFKTCACLKHAAFPEGKTCPKCRATARCAARKMSRLSEMHPPEVGRSLPTEIQELMQHNKL